MKLVNVIWQAVAEDLTVASMLGSGNDYLPGVKGLPQLVPVRGSSAGLWDAYLKLRASPTWAHRRALWGLLFRL